MPPATAPPATKKIILLQYLDQTTTHVLHEQLAIVPGLEIRTEDTPPADDKSLVDVILCPPDATPARPAPLITVDHDHQRLGMLLADIARALDEPLLAMPPFLVGCAVFFPAEKKLSHPEKGETLLTEREAALLVHLARSTPQAVRRDDLLKAVWGYQEGIDTHTLETHIYRLRQKIEDDAAAPDILRTTEEGYLLSAALPGGEFL